MPSFAARASGDMTDTVLVSAPKRGDIFLVRPGASVPADGEAIDGHSNVNEAMITGESKPVHQRHCGCHQRTVVAQDNPRVTHSGMSGDQPPDMPVVWNISGVMSFARILVFAEMCFGQKGNSAYMIMGNVAFHRIIA